VTATETREIGAAPAALPAARRAQRWRVVASRTVVALALLALWQLAHRMLGDLFFPAPAAVAQRIVELGASGELFTHLTATLSLAAVGFVIGAYCAIALAFLLHRFDRLYRASEPYLIAWIGIPKYALAPLLILWFGIGATPKIFIVGAMVFYLVFVPALSGLRSVDPRLVAMARVLGASERDIRRKISWRWITPFILAGLRIALPRAIGAEIVGEFLVADRGLGFYIENSRQMADTVGVFAGIVVVTALVLVIDALLEALSRSLLAWRPVDSHAVT